MLNDSDLETNKVPWLERVIIASVITFLCCMLLLVNILMLFTLKSKTVFRETSRYILLYNLLSADTLQMTVSQILFMLSICRVTLLYPVCGVLVMFAYLISEVPPLTLVVMSLERYVAVCFPLRHSTMVNVENTGLAILVLWSLCLLNTLIRVVLLLQLPFEELESLQMKTLCNILLLFLVPESHIYDTVYNTVLFVFAGVAVIFSYISVMIAARSASADKASTQKARDTLLLHLIQLCLILISTVHSTLIVNISQIVSRLVFIRIMNVFYIFIIILPKCLSALIYALRDHTIRPVFFKYLFCQFKVSSLKD
ncbi:odorant receptor 131-2-like [Xyrichtys novacula]|uniref:Odorant receptor 131-2-like n=1 Tax=Xyrichtys novacula TaxID=13765 RepID=A0AAV1FRM5_XYRNO|nr:odorant receptor 131-2-like [Xyrichtys novacula]